MSNFLVVESSPADGGAVALGPADLSARRFAEVGGPGDWAGGGFSTVSREKPHKIGGWRVGEHTTSPVGCSAISNPNAAFWKLPTPKRRKELSRSSPFAEEFKSASKHNRRPELCGANSPQAISRTRY